MLDVKATVVEVVDALQAVVDAMRRFDAARMGLPQDTAGIDAERRVYAAIVHLRHLLQAPIHDAGRPDGRGVSLEFVDWPPGAEVVRKAVLSLNDIPPLSWESEVFSPNIPGSTERLLAVSLARFASVLETLERIAAEPVAETGDPLDDELRGQLLLIYQFIRDRGRPAKGGGRVVTFADLDRQDFWRSSDRDDGTIIRALRKLQHALSRNATCGKSLRIEERSGRATLT